MKTTLLHCSHGFPAYFNPDSRILILGSFPSVKSREEAFYYAHPQNRFWKVLSSVYADSLPQTLTEKMAFLRRHRLALWDVIESCDIIGSGDASIKNAESTDIPAVLRSCPIEKIILNGKTAERLFYRFQPDITLPAAALPSTSPANAAWSLQKLAEVWRSALI